MERKANLLAGKSCVIIDDDIISALNIRIKLEELGMTILKVLDNLEELKESLAFFELDIIISDVKLGVNKFSYDLLKKVDVKVPIIFYTSYSEGQLYDKSKDLKPYVYLIKPVDSLTLRSAIEGALSDFKTIKLDNSEEKGSDILLDKKVLFVRVKGKLISVNPAEIVVVRSEGNYCYLLFENKKIVIRSSLKNVIDKMKYFSFIRVHRSYFVNSIFIKSISFSNDEVVLKNQSNNIPIGRKYKKELRQLGV